MTRRRLAVAFLAGLAGCGGLDKFLEGNQPSEARIRLTLASPEVTVTAGRDTLIPVTVTRTGDFTGAVSLGVEGLPDGVTATVEGSGATGQVTGAAVTLRIGAATAPGRYPLAVRGRAPTIPVDGLATLVLNVLPVPAFSVELSQTALTIARGGIAPATIRLVRTNFNAPVTFSFQGAPQLGASFPDNPASGTMASMVLSVPADAPIGPYSATLRATGTGVPERSVPLTITVTDDPLQLVAPPQATTRQGSVLPLPLVLNRAGVSGAVQLSAEGLPAGMSVEFDPVAATGSTATLSLSVMPQVPSATYTLRVRGRSPGVPDAVADIQVGVTASGLSLGLAPTALTLFEGGSASSTLTLVRSDLEAPVGLAVESAPGGMTVTTVPVSVTGSSAVVTVQAGSVPAGSYTVVLRATPASWPAGAFLTIPLGVTVRGLPTGTGNAVVSWAGCATPGFLAVQDGTGPWTALPVGPDGVRFNVTSGRGGVAWVESNSAIQVRWLTQAEFTAGPLDLCPPAPPPGGRTVTAQAVHYGALEQFSYAFGGASATSTQAAPTVTLGPVPPGTHDLIAWGNTATSFGLRGFIRRDLDPDDGASLGSVDLLGAESFAPIRPTLTVTGPTTLNEVFSHSMTYLTTAACTPNLLYAGASAFSALMSGVPLALQRGDDFHMLTVTGTLGSRVRYTTLSLHALSSRTVTLPPLVPAPFVTVVPGAYLRLNAAVGSFSGSYNGTITFRYASGLRTVTMAASIGYAGLTGVVLTMPDFSALPGWPATAAIPVGSNGAWSLINDGSFGGSSPCSDGRSTVFMHQSGAF